jgi:UDP-N-acetylmuramoylalanine--D-glutamate ligase
MGEPLMPLRAGLTSWHADWADLKVLVVGLGATGFSVADTLWELGSTVFVVTREAGDNHRAMLDALGVEYVLAEDEAAMVAKANDFAPDVIIVSPGINPRHPIVAWAQGAGVPVWSDMELAWRVRDKVRAAEWILITGTNGKTTTTQLTSHVLSIAGFRTAAVGNIGTPVLDAIRDPLGFDFLVVEISSFQLHWLPGVGEGALRPISSACLNVGDDHLDWHGTAAAYRAAKGAVYANTRVAVLYSKVDPVTEALVRDANVAEGCEAIGFGFMTPDTGELGTIEGLLVDRAFVPNRRNTAHEIVTIDHLAELGFATPHMILNILAASGLALSAGASAEAVAEALDSFALDRHRCETVAEFDGIRWVDDSKATNAHAANASLRSFPSLVWIVGGLFKGTAIDELVQAHASRLRAVIAIGLDRDEPRRVMAEWAPHIPFVEIIGDEIMAQAVAAAAARAHDGDTVLLAPAAASMDQFVDYADRGRQFAAAVRAHLGLGDE